MLNNVSSEHIATHEIFQDQPHLNNRIIDAFGIDDSDIIVAHDEESNSNLTIQLELSEDRMNYIVSVLDDYSSIDYKSKYLQIVNIFKCFK